MRVDRLFLLLIALAVPVTAIAQYLPAPGGEDLMDLYSPVILAEAGPLSSGSGPQTDALNPATSGLIQRTVLDASYIAR